MVAHRAIKIREKRVEPFPSHSAVPGPSGMPPGRPGRLSAGSSATENSAREHPGTFRARP